ncbi:MBL fold metallo-hydrolase [Oceanobacillus sp. AG]|uniref:MBL fold metallo-hydrolase n=1 Tax=Oceanobacillus sp. AG TaxID=2681969 RepID=UPI0012EC05C0|nr:MBL fold metallo-hydrolase [Oceanobacillus sp. AG]
MSGYRENDMYDAMENKFLPMYSIASGVGVKVLPDLYCYTNQIVNICLVGDSADDFVLIDTGMPESSGRIIEAIEERFGADSKPKAIILTHGHFDHVGAVVDLVEKWDVKVYAHEKELPFLTGKQSYPDPDGTVEGGLVAKMSPMFPTDPVDLGSHVEALPSDGTVPHMPEWRWVHTPGHAPGQIALFREEDRALIAADTFVTVKQESLYKVMTQELEINGPPRYLTTDWNAAWESVKKLQELNPSVAVTGHGVPVEGQELTEGLARLVSDFDKIAIPDYGRYVDGEH